MTDRKSSKTQPSSAQFDLNEHNFVTVDGKLTVKAYSDKPIPFANPSKLTVEAKKSKTSKQALTGVEEWTDVDVVSADSAPSSAIPQQVTPDVQDGESLFRPADALASDNWLLAQAETQSLNANAGVSSGGSGASSSAGIPGSSAGASAGSGAVGAAGAA
ncbi:MAG: hypothetical protein ACKO0Z_18755, partial [Betaproteobacteria bacterium]